MSNSKHTQLRSRFPLAVVLGTNEIASAVAVSLRGAGYSVVLSHDPYPPVIRRKMAFHDVLFDEPVTLGGLSAVRADTGIELRQSLAQEPNIVVTRLVLLDLIVIRPLDKLIDARMQKNQVKPDLRRLAHFAIGLGPGFCTDFNCDVAVETRPDKQGRIIREGLTEAPDGTSLRLGGHGGERFVRAEQPGRWHTAVEIGTRVFKDFVVGYLGNTPLRAPFDGFLRGLVRDGTEVPAGVKLFEIDARGRRATWTGIDRRSQEIAEGVMRAIAMHRTETSVAAARKFQLVK